MDPYDKAPCIYFSAADDGTITAVNHFTCYHLGYQPEELSDKKLETIYTLPTRIFQQTHFFPLLTLHGHAEEIFITLLTKNGEHLPVLINAERQTANNKTITIYTGIIVRNRKKFEDELVAAKRAAETALNQNTALLQVKMELQEHAEQLDHQVSLVNRQNTELRQFNRVVTHDLQEPIRKLFIFTSRILEHKDEKASANTLNKIIAVSEQMRSIVSALQQYVWLIDTPVNLTRLNLEKLLPIVKQDLEEENPGVDISIEVEELLPVQADQEQMKFLLHEILSNAVRFRKPANRVNIRVASKSLLLNKFKTMPGKYRYTPYVKLDISDEGTGFDPVYKQQVFELFKKLHPVSGRGVGLSLCKKIVENHKGDITIDSKKETGTTVSIWLPEQQENALPEKQEQ